MAYNDLIKDTIIVRSMSLAGKMADNPLNEALNGWIKEELFMDFRIRKAKSREDIEEVIRGYVTYSGEERPCYALRYDTPKNYLRRYEEGEIERKETFSDRILSKEPKFVRKRREKAERKEVSGFGEEIR